jgi:hypothetical protein
MVVALPFSNVNQRLFWPIAVGNGVPAGGFLKPEIPLALLQKSFVSFLDST